MSRVSSLVTGLFYSICGFLLTHIPAHAEETVLPTSGKQADCIKDGSCSLSDVPFFIVHIASYLVGIAGTISVVMVMLGGYQYIFEGASEAAKGKGKKTLIYAVVGLIITLLSFVIVNMIQVNMANPTPPTP